MTTNYDSIAVEYKKSKETPWRTHIECFTLFELVGKVDGKSVLDLACGEGYYTRRLKEQGAARVVGVDLSQEMIRLARAQEVRNPLGVEYVVQDVRRLHLEETFDLVVAGYLLNYARTKGELQAMAWSIAHSLKSGGRFVTVNNNPDHPAENFDATRKYGFVKRVQGEIREGTPITWTFFLEEGTFDIENYYLSRATHEWAFQTAGLKDICWYPPWLSQVAAREWGWEFWSEFLRRPPIIFFECAK